MKKVGKVEKVKDVNIDYNEQDVQDVISNIDVKKDSYWIALMNQTTGRWKIHWNNLQDKKFISCVYMIIYAITAIDSKLTGMIHTMAQDAHLEIYGKVFVEDKTDKK